jgi:LuxR family maltose regulon positive regulatory protein
MLSLVNEKCIPAALPEVHIPRQELMKKLHLAAADRFIYIGAPAGSGKTVTALLWNAVCRQTPSGRTPLWITLDAYDNVPSVFYKLLSAVLCSTQTNNQNMQDVLADPAFSSSPVEYTIRLMTELQVDENLYTLTFDDLHLINNPDILKSLPAVLKRLPRSFVVLFLSRNEPPQPLRVMFKDEKTAVIGRNSLKFSEKELKTYFKNLGRALSDKEAEFVLMATGGLAIGINAMAKSESTAGITRHGSGKNEYVFAHYIREQLWANWEKDLQEFMLKTSVVDEMTEKLASTLTGCKNAGKVLGDLCASNTFVSQTGKDLFRYHHLFLDFLRDMARESGMNLAVLYKAAAKYYLDAKQYLIARHYAVQSGNDEIILKVIHQFNQYTNPLLDEYAAYSKIFSHDVLPKGICDRHPYLYTSIMEGAWILSDTKTVEHAWDKLREYLPIMALKYPKILETIILELAVDYRKSFKKLIADFAKLPPIIRPSRKYQVSTLTLQLPFAHRSIRDFSEFDDDDLDKITRSFGRLLYDLMPAAKLCLLSGFSLEKNLLDEALAYALQAKKTAANIESPEIIFCVHNHLSAVYLAMGNKMQLKASLAETEHYLQSSKAQFLNRNFLALKTKIRLMDADKKAAEEWLDSYFVSEDELSSGEQVPLYKVFQYFTTARAYIVLNKGGKALAVIEALIQFARNYRRPLDLAEAMALKACLEWACGHRAEAAACLEEILLELQDRGFIQVIADEGAAVVPVLKRIASGISGSEDYKGKLNRTYVTKVLMAAHQAGTQNKGITAYFRKSGRPVKLSKQQIKMLELLAQGYKNQEIARITSLALPTVKGHLMLAYEKLEVNNAMDALLKAKSLELLSGKNTVYLPSS